VYTCFVHFKKSFNTVNYWRLFYNLFSNQIFCTFDAVVKLISGLIHGSVIRPPMFLIYTDLIVGLHLVLFLMVSNYRLTFLIVLILLYYCLQLLLLPVLMNDSCLCLSISVVSCTLVKARVLLLNSVNSIIPL